MALLHRTNTTRQEIEVLERLEKQLERREKRQRIQRFIIGGLAFMVVASFVAGGCVGHRCSRGK